tara:strand:+ start:1702 stop:2043 length:342 start_codon:yes stop_codon:yes gene_type:complete
MTLKNYLFAFFAFFSLAIHAQTENTTITSITEFKVETDNLEELADFNWKTVANIFENNTPETKVKMTFAYIHKAEYNGADVNNFELSISGKTSELTSMILKSKGIIAKLSEVN